MLSDQLPSIDALANRFHTFLDSLTANFTPLVVQPRGSFFMVPEHFLVDNFTVYKSLRLVKPRKSSGAHPIPGTVWEEFALGAPSLPWTFTTHRLSKVVCLNPSNGRM